MKFVRKIKIVLLAMVLVLSVMAVPGYCWTHDGGSGYHRYDSYDRGHDSGYRHYGHGYRGHGDWDGPRYSTWHGSYYRPYYAPSFSFVVPGFSFYVSP
jgi:hypothetical protein